MLETLFIQIIYDAWDGPLSFVSWLLAVPTLKNLDIWDTHGPARVTEIVSALAPHQSQAQPDTTILPLPNLRSLRFVRDYAPFLGFPAVASMLDARRSTLKEFKLYMEEVGDSGVPDAGTAAAFERLRKEAGMEIFVGRMMPTYFEDLNRRILTAWKRFS